MYEIPGSNIRQVKITEDAVMGRSKPEYSELVRDKTSKNYTSVNDELEVQKGRASNPWNLYILLSKYGRNTQQNVTNFNKKNRYH